MEPQKKGMKRNTIDKYYTKETTVDLCLRNVVKHLRIENDDLVIEPSAGNGSFISGIKELSSNCRFLDLEPGDDEIIKQDYLSYTYTEQSFGKVHVIGNPPFGRQSSTAIKFVKKSCGFCNSVSFILPKSFKKDSLRRSFPLSFHLICEIDLPDNSFMVDGVEHDVPCIFQIWEKKSVDRCVIDKLKPVNFKFVKKTENPDISFRRVGVNAGVIDVLVKEKSIQSHYFIKFINNKNTRGNIQSLTSVIFSHDNTVGPRSISKQELIYEFNQHLK